MYPFSFPLFQANGTRKGSVLVIFMLSLIIIFGLAALAIDMGILRLTQRQMQTASDAAALRGLQLRDTPGDRRLTARETVSNVFDDDFDLASDPFKFGAGPTYTITSAIPGDMDGGVIVSTSVYDPLLEPNTTNQPHGDMLSGDYNSTQRHDEGYNGVNFYERDDFPSGFDELASLTPPNSFLVRLRRTRNATGLDSDPGISSTGPTLPVIFGRGTPMASGGGSFSPFRDGFTITAVSIADAKPTLTFGPDHSSLIFPPSGIPGVSYYALDADFWSVLPVGVWIEAAILADGSIAGIGATSGGVDARLIRRTDLSLPLAAVSTSLFVFSSTGFPVVPFTARLGDTELVEVTAVDVGTGEWTITRGVNGTTPTAFVADTPVYLFESQIVTDLLPATLPIDSLVPVPGVAEIQYVPLFDQFVFGERVVGFGAAQMRPIGPVPAPLVFPVSVEIQRLATQIPELNNSAKLGKTVDSSLSDTEINLIFAERNSLDGPVRSPALVRSY